MATVRGFPTIRKAWVAMAARMTNVSKSYGPVPALRDFNLAVRAGALTAVLGPNGAGKTTAIKLLLGLVRPSSGTVTALGGDPASPATHLRMGAMLQAGRVPETLRVREHIDLFSSIIRNRCRGQRPWRLPESRISRIANSASCRLDKNKGCYSHLRSAEILTCCFWMSRRWASM
jgi:ABC-type multidrug transport system ATPase subunit